MQLVGTIMEDLMKSLFLVLSCRQKLKELNSRMDDYSIDNPESDRRHEGFSSQGGGIRDIESFMEVLTKADADLAYSSEKLVNLHGLLIHLLAWDDDLEVVAMENSYISTTSFEKALVFDLLSGIFDSEVREVENFMDNIQADIVDARHKIFSNKHSTELVTIMGEKLHDTEESLYKTQERLAEVKKQSIKLQSASPTFRLENCKLHLLILKPIFKNFLLSHYLPVGDFPIDRERRQVLGVFSQQSTATY